MTSATVQHVCSLINKRDYLAFESIVASTEVQELKKTDAELFKLLETLKSGTVTDLESFDKSVFDRYGLVYEAVLAKLRVIQFVCHVNQVAIAKSSATIELTLDDVSKVASCKSSLDAEDVVVLAVSLGLIQATIDDNSDVVRISAVTPVRDLDSKALWKTLEQRIDSWLANVRELKEIAAPLSA